MTIFTCINNHEHPFDLLLLVLNNNKEIQEQNQIKISNLHYTRLVPVMGVASLRDPSPLQSATDTQFNVATLMGHKQLVLDLIDAGIDPGLPNKIWH